MDTPAEESGYHQIRNKRTPAAILDLIEAKGKEVSAASPACVSRFDAAGSVEILASRNCTAYKSEHRIGLMFTGNG